MKLQKSALIKRLVIFAAGIFIMATGVSFSVKSDLGVSPVTSVPYVLSRIFGLSLGTWTIFFYIFCMALQAAILRREYKLINLFQIAASFAFGWFTDLSTRMISFLPVTDNYIVRFVYLALGICCVAFGILLYLTTALIALPTDGTVQAISYKGGFKLHKVKIAYDSVSTAISLVLSLAVLRGLNGLGVGTVIASFGVGRMLGVFTALLKKRLTRFLNIPPDDGPAPPRRTLHTRGNAKKAG
ncbi:Uncharacterized membrane protein YczE [Sporobacter termitidis DSM 10068]|uniref:Uncharacterized membrane protein YczE n=1 Tax=Sporobacter termitidis DSM 10068 TaxID=1123282 RepID=A0A1M5YGG9_9FIRM|nr:DUF6198 family protein [Sporobacter termitidis]SHI11140.1 Uncharacterized membrane protein YczE [Sporobacter termitidis DSM 10068]